MAPYPRVVQAEGGRSQAGKDKGHDVMAEAFALSRITGRALPAAMELVSVFRDPTRAVFCKEGYIVG